MCTETYDAAVDKINQLFNVPDTFIMDDSLLENNTIETFDMLQQNLARF